ncbi:hypothetical protein KXD93_06990 [Mucilaginibacter sp. BJC16-A38]|uniref:hypothetical protein n=1 Tax=Mucilaginibacter phenanthrenivorans TaxID=1234842 RepID=UPI002158778B|nr:hypothetical protein [Mucilaginibacter phenanthrenivorans]MCR8557380.1 hypothetical protein [Mucilaginibacter phenanthrenivorans]
MDHPRTLTDIPTGSKEQADKNWKGIKGRIKRKVHTIVFPPIHPHESHFKDGFSIYVTKPICYSILARD